MLLTKYHKIYIGYKYLMADVNKQLFDCLDFFLFLLIQVPIK